MKRFEITFKDLVLAEDEEQAYKNFLDYLERVVEVEDLDAFGFVEVK